MRDRIISLIVIALQLIVAIISLRTAILNRKKAKEQKLKTIAVNPKQKPSLVIVFVIISLSIYLVSLEIYNHFIVTGQDYVDILGGIIGLVFSAFFLGTHMGLWMWADIIIKPIDKGIFSMIV